MLNRGDFLVASVVQVEVAVLGGGLSDCQSGRFVRRYGDYAVEGLVPAVDRLVYN
jgi:hypothetical protein